MASFENLANLDGWTFRSTFADPWISDAFSRDTETLTKALQKSLSGGNAESLISDTISPFLGLIKPESAPTPAVSGVSGSDQEPPLPAPKRQRSANPPAAAKATKRKSRASKRSQTTFITADPANFRQMVQQVTGGTLMQMAPTILKPEPQRLAASRYQGVGGGCLLPTLDTSAFLLDQVVGPAAAVGVGGGQGPLCFPQPVVADGVSALDYDAFSNFPTLESWKVM